MRYVILGGSIAGLSAAKAVRDKDASGEIVIITGEKTGPYYRPMIPLLLSGRRKESEIKYPEDPLIGRNITTVLGTAIDIDVKGKEVVLASEERIPFDTLLLATGSAPVKPSIAGLEGSGVYPLRTMAHAGDIRGAARISKNIVVIGGGLVGIKAALALRERSALVGRIPPDVTVVEMLPEILNSRLDRISAKLLNAAVIASGVSVMTGQAVDEIVRSNSAVTGVKLVSGKKLHADMVIVAAGAKPNVVWLKRAGIKADRGVLVDENLTTNVPGIFAAGDVAEGRNLLTGGSGVSGLWSNALEMGRVAGANMAGGRVTYPGFMPVMNATDIAGVPFISVGNIEPEDGKCEIISHEDEKCYWKLVLDRDFLVGAVFVGDLKRAGVYVNLIKNRVPVSRIRDDIRKRSLLYADLLKNSSV